MEIQGQCHCGDIAYEAVVDPERVSVCHCTDCQHLTGTAWRVSVGCRQADFRLLRGTPTVYVKVGDSGVRRAQHFCGRCGSPLYVHTEGDTATMSLRVGNIAQRAQLAPKRQIWCRSALPWALDVGGLPAAEREWQGSQAPIGGAARP
jgi:hypothetical protein